MCPNTSNPEWYVLHMQRKHIISQFLSDYRRADLSVFLVVQQTSVHQLVQAAYQGQEVLGHSQEHRQVTDIHCQQSLLPLAIVQHDMSFLEPYEVSKSSTYQLLTSRFSEISSI